MRPPVKTLSYDSNKWVEEHPVLTNTLQLFITERCNLRCPECFNMNNLGKRDMSLEFYKKTVDQFSGQIGKVLLSGGEPTLHRKIREIIRFNHNRGLKTTIYTNGARLDQLIEIPLQGLSVRVSIFGIEDCVNALRDLEPYSHLPVMFTYMLKKDNVDELLPAAQILEREYNCQDLLISTCLGEDYWTEYENTITLSRYPDIINDFLAQYDGQMTLHFASRGVIQGKQSAQNLETCRFGNIFLDKLIQCPYDIQRNLTTEQIKFGTVKCNKNNSCLLSKIMLKRLSSN